MIEITYAADKIHPHELAMDHLPRCSGRVAILLDILFHADVTQKNTQMLRGKFCITSVYFSVKHLREKMSSSALICSE